MDVEESLDDIAAKFIVSTPVKEDDKKSATEQGETVSEVQEESQEVAVVDPKDSEGADEVEPGPEDEEETPEEDLDIDEVEVDVTIDGETKSVKLKELKANYSGEGAIQKRLQEATEVRQKVYEVGAHLYQNLEAQSERLKRLDEVLSTAVEQPINWEELRQKEPGRYLLEKERVREIEEKQARVRAEQQRIYQEQQELNEMAMRDITIQQAKLLVERIPELAKPETAKPVMRSFIETAQAYGFTPEDVHGIVDHRLMLVLADAAKYRQGLSMKDPKNPLNPLKESKPRKLVRPSSSAVKGNSAVNAFKKQHEANLKRAKATGSVDDVAKLLMVRKKSG